MKLSNISAANLKGFSFSYNLAPINIIAGPNGTGKTAALDAIQLLLSGTHALYGTTRPRIFQLSSGAVMSVAGILDTQPVTRTWTQKGKTVGYEDEGTAAIPEGGLNFLVADKYLDANDSKRLQMVFELCEVEFSPGELVAGILNKIDRESDLFATVRTCLAIEGPEEKDNSQRWLEGAITRTNDELKLANSEVSRLGKTGEGVAQLAAGDIAINEGNVRQRKQALEKAVAELNQAEGALRERRAQYERSATNHSLWADKIKSLTAALGSREARELGVVEDELFGIRGQRQEILDKYQTARHIFSNYQERAGKLTSVRERYDQALKTLEHHKAEAAKLPECQAALDACAPLQAKVEQIRADRSALEADAARLKAEIAAAVVANEAANAHFESIKNNDCCPTCQTAGTVWKTALQTALNQANDEFAVADANAKALLEAVDADITFSYEQLRAAVTELGDSEDPAKAALAQAHYHQRQAAAQQNTVSQLLQDGRKLKAELGEAPPEPPKPDLSVFDAEIDRLTAELPAARTQRELHETRAAEPVLPPPVTNVEQNALLQERAHLDAEAEEVRIQEQTVANQRAQERTLQQAQDERNNATARAESLKEIKANLTKERDDLVEKAFGPLLKTMQIFTAGILPTPVQYHQGELGRFAGMSWIPLKLFSGTHLAVTAAGLQAALGAQSPLKLAVVDEMGRFDNVNKGVFLNNVRVAIREGIVDQFLGVDVDPAPYAASMVKAWDNFQLIETTRTAD